MRLYHIISTNDKTGDSVFMTRKPLPHAKACTMLAKFTKHAHRTLSLMEAIQ